VPPPSPASRPRTVALGAAALFLAAVVAYGYRLGALGFTEPDEARYAAVAREMISTADPVTPRFNGFIYLDKPPLLHWVTALAFYLAGPSELVGRAVSVLAAAAGVALIYAFGAAAFGPRAGVIAGLVLVSSLIWFVMGRVLRFDMILTLAVSAALWFAWQASELGERGKRYWALAAGAIALGTLTKGPVAVALPVAILLAYVVITRRLRVLREVPWVACLAVFAAIVAPWSILCERANPGALRFMLLQENLARAAGEVGETHARPWWFFLAILPAGLLPWSLCLPGALVDAVGPRARAQEREWRATVLALLWLVLPLVLFSIPKGKLFAYILPSIPAAALLAGRYLAAPPQRSRVTLVATGALLVAASIALQTLGVRAMAGRGYPVEPYAPLIALLFLLSGLAAAVLGLTPRSQVALPLVALGALGSYHLAARSAELVYPPISERPLARLVAALRHPGEKLTCYGRMSRAVLFYLDEPVLVVGFWPGEYDFPANRLHLAGRYFPFADAERVFAHRPAMIGTARLKDWRELNARVPARVRRLATDGRNVVFRTVPETGPAP
jgi:4-amino-4-deoxy-L-arabinose transferase-like glycosyltransferase